MTKGFQKYVETVTTKYLARREAIANTYLEVEYSPVTLYDDNYNRENNDTQYFPLKQRFTKEYGNSIYQKLKVLTGLNIYSFWTLTSRVDGSMLGFQDQHLLIKKGWRDFRSLMSKVGLKRVDYLRVYELTDKFGLHIHIAFYSVLSTFQIKKLAEYWDRTRGFVKIFVYHNHVRSWPKSLLKDAFEPYRKDNTDYGQVHALRRQSFVQNGIIGFGSTQEVRLDGKVSKYVWKYMVKLASVEKQAILWDNRIRTYSVSQSLNKHIQTAREQWKEENKIDRGQVVNLGIFKQNWSEDITWKKEFYKKLEEKSNYAESWNNDIYTIELIFPYNEFGKEQIHLEIGFNANSVTVHIIDRFGSHREPLTGFHGFNNINWFRVFAQSDEGIARDLLLRYFPNRFRCSISIS